MLFLQPGYVYSISIQNYIPHQPSIPQLPKPYSTLPIQLPILHRPKVFILGCVSLCADGCHVDTGADFEPMVWLHNEEPESIQVVGSRIWTLNPPKS